MGLREDITGRKPEDLSRAQVGVLRSLAAGRQRFTHMQKEFLYSLLIRVTRPMVDEYKVLITDKRIGRHRPPVLKDVNGNLYVPFKIVIDGLRNDSPYKPYLYLLKQGIIIPRENVTFPEPELEQQ